MADKAKEIKAPEVKSTTRRDKLHAIQRSVQQRWDELKINETSRKLNADGTEREKFLVTFPYPYMNGYLHLGHAFSMSKAEFQVRYQRQKGKNCIFPFGFHCTGMPIQAAANRLKAEITSGNTRSK